MLRIKKLLNQVKRGQWILIALAIGMGITAALIGISDNLPGIILIYLSLTCLAVSWVWSWHSPREFWILLGLALLSFPVGVFLHNMLYALGTVVNNIPILAGLIEFLEVIFFLFAVIVAGLVGIVALAGDFLEVIFFLIAVIVAGPVGTVALAGGIFTSWKGIPKIVKRNRSYRRFDQRHQITDKQLVGLINLARLSASGANLQPLKYVLSNTEEKNAKIFPTLSWAGYLKEWSGPVEGEKPSAYIVMLGDTEIDKGFEYDAGIACQSILMGAADQGLGGCIIGSVKRKTLREVLAIPERYEIVLVLALGKPTEQVVIEDLEPGGDIKYWRDENGVHHVPKRGLGELILDL